MSKKSLLLAAALTVAAGTPASAAQFTFFGEDRGLGEAARLPAYPNALAARASFLSSLVGVGTETFESFATGATAPLAATFPGAGTATIVGAGNIANVPSGTNGGGRYPISGNQYWEVTGAFSIEFDEPIAAFGFFGVDIGDFSGQITLTFTNGTTTTLTVPNSTGVPGGGVLFFGFIDTDNTFKKVTFGNTAAGTDFFGFDDFTIGSLQQVRIPEPASLALFGLALAGLGALARRPVS
ncbi:MAG: PEP-CTERM sorting domain-containing protein [Acetobacteraceae bacterium]|nr:PEP-CTERM sorting domain-containing protein [Acetobacteraceae bacterium]